MDFNFDMLTMRQLIKLAGAYNVKLNGSIPNIHDSMEDIVTKIKEELKVLEDGAIVRKDEKKSHNEIKLLGGNSCRMIII
jgi:ACT domain-containing protein